MAATADPGGDPETTASERQLPGGPPSGRRRLRVLAGWVLPAVAALLLAFGLRAFALQAFSNPSGSMEPTLGIGDRILVWKAFFTWHDVRQGDVVVFTHPPLDHCPGPPDSDLVKRVIALPGQTIYSAGNSIYVDGRRLREPYLPPHDPLGSQIPAASRAAPFHVPPGEFYVMGDNRQVLRQPVLGPDQGQQHYREGGVSLLAQRPSRFALLLTEAADSCPARRRAGVAAAGCGPICVVSLPWRRAVTGWLASWPPRSSRAP